MAISKTDLENIKTLLDGDATKTAAQRAQSQALLYALLRAIFPGEASAIIGDGSA